MGVVRANRPATASLPECKQAIHVTTLAMKSIITLFDIFIHKPWTNPLTARVRQISTSARSDRCPDKCRLTRVSDGERIMHPLMTTLDLHLDRLTQAQLLALAVCGLFLVGMVDYLIGFELSVAVFYVAPVAIAAWYAGRRAGIAIAVLACVSLHTADAAAGHLYSHAEIPLWNALVMFAFLVIIASLLTLLRENLRDQQYLARIDGLTGLYCRRMFDVRLEHDLALARRRKGTLALAYIDVDDFKTVNDIYGHVGGDRVLKEISQVLKDSIREADTAARIGGDEFALVLPDTDVLGARQLVSEIVRKLHEAFAGSNWQVTCSVGVITVLDAAVSPESAVAAADKVMYQVKAKGKDAVEFSVFDGTLHPYNIPDRQQPASPPAASR